MALKIGSSAILLCDIRDASNYIMADVSESLVVHFQRGRRVILSAEPVDNMVRISSPDDMTISVYISLESLKPCRGRPRVFDFRV